MKNPINLFAVSESLPLLDGIEKLLLVEKSISLYSGSINFHLPLKNLHNSDTMPVNNSVLFMDNLSISNNAAIHFLEKNKFIINDTAIKTIVYTGSNDKEYLNTLLDMNVNSVLHNNETPLKDFLVYTFYRGQRSGQERLHYPDAGKKFIETVKSVRCELNYYDGPVLSLVLKRNWSKDSINFNIHPPGEKSSIISEGIDEHILNAIHNLFPDAGEIIKNLTRKEREVMVDIAECKSNRQIADDHTNFWRTIDTIKTRIKEKYGFENSKILFLFCRVFKEKIKDGIK